MAKLQAPLQAPGGELSLIPIEQLIKIEDIRTPPIKPVISATSMFPATPGITGPIDSTTSNTLMNLMNPKTTPATNPAAGSVEQPTTSSSSRNQ